MINRSLKLAFLILGALLSSAFSTALDAESLRGVTTSHIDRKADPCIDFNQFANGAWLDANEIPPDRASWGAWGELYEANIQQLKSVIEASAASQRTPGSIEQKIADFHAAAMDTAAIEAAGIKPLAAELKAIADIKTAADLETAIARLHRLGINIPFGVWVYQDAKNSRLNIANIHQSGLGLPDREYYLSDDAETAEIRGKYQQHVRRILELAGDSPEIATNAAERILAFETRLAKASMTPVQQRDPDSTYNSMSIAELTGHSGNFNWQRYFAALGQADPGRVNVAQKVFVQEVGVMSRETSLDDWKAYLRFHLLESAAPYLSSAFVNEDFDFNARTMQGRKELRPRWKRVINQMDNSLGELLGRLYVEKYFPASSKQHVEQMVVNLKAALRDRLAAIDWITEPTRLQAFRKLDAINWKIGYPAKWRDHSTLTIKTDSYAQNVFRATEYAAQFEIDKINKPYDPNEFGMTPPTINAYYSALSNEIVFPAGILQPPFFDPGVDDAINYGAIGAVIGHELTHGFDDEGRKYDAEGNLKEWWTPEDAAKFEERAEMIRQQYSQYVAIDTFKVNGDLTSGENIADLGGLRIAYYAYKKSLEGKPAPPVIDGFTAEQRFFIGFAHIWRSKIRPEAEKMYLGTDPHSPDRFRINGTLANMPEFAEAFGCQPGKSLLRPAEQLVKIW